MSFLQRHRTVTIAAAAGALLLLGGAVYVLSGDTPTEVSIDTAADTGSNVPGEATADPSGTGAWTVDSDAVAYDFDASTGSFVGFRVDEELSTIGFATAVGRTPAVTGSLEVEDTTLSEATFTADLTVLTTDDGRRDSKARAAMGPEAVFVLDGPVELSGPLEVGTTVTTEATGQLTINGVTDERTITVEGALVEPGLLVVTSTFDVSFEDHGITAPSANIVLGVEDHGTIEVQLYLSR